MKYKLQHLFFWLLLLGLWYMLRFEDYASRSIAFEITLIKVVDLAFLVYITNYLLIPKLLYKKLPPRIRVPPETRLVLVNLPGVLHGGGFGRRQMARGQIPVRARHTGCLWSCAVGWRRAGGGESDQGDAGLQISLGGG